ncbi:cytochrome c [Oricola sp.]|uniref:c-type cytochrome n=1 Tax=Oricola sp. TaxID=1979950 RepID=UPI0025D9F2BB|nr:cytochrome c [Oricola sp.]MCI5073567.1 cytochrome c [Oricola sp.]
MKKTVLTLSLVAAATMSAFAADDPVATRKALMQANGGAAGVAAGLMKGDIEYNPAVGKNAITALYAVSQTFGDYFPDGSDMAADTKASSKIWEDAAGWQAELDKFASASAAAVEASGRSGPADLDAFKAAVGPVLGSCRSCHEGYQTR